jgi:secreted trypsin-like serine protease
MLVVVGALAACQAGDDPSAADPTSLTNSRVDPAHPEVMMFMPYDPDFPARGCSALLVAPRLAVTSAHCLQAPGGWVDAKQSLLWSNGERFAIVNAYTHPAYTSAVEHDLAALVLAQAAPIQPAPIGADPRNGDGVTLVGYGITSSDRSQDQNADIGNAQRRSGTNTIDGVAQFSIRLSGSSWGNSATCEGDSGGPAFVDHGSGAEAIALTSRGTCDSQFSYLGWVDGNVSFMTRLDTNRDLIDGVTQTERLY